MDFDEVRISINAACSKIISGLFTALCIGFLLSISAPAQAAPSTTQACTAGAGLGAIAGVSTNQAGHGCVVIKYNNGSANVYETFNYTGTDQSWTSPESTTTLTL